MKRIRAKRTKPQPPLADSMEQAIAIIWEVITAYCRPRLLDRRNQLLGWSLACEVSEKGDELGGYVLTFMPEHDTAPCHSEPRPSTTRFSNLRFGITRDSVTNALFHALSWPGSPYWFDGKRWDRKMQIYG